MNLLYAGSCFDVAHLIEPADLVFLDPPYNTGRNWADYPDSMTLVDWLDLIGHALDVAHDVLRPAGSVWVNVSERHSHRVRVLADAIFGAECWVATIAWRKHYRASGCQGIKTMHDPIIVYSRSPGWARRNGLPPGPAQTARYANPNADPQGPWRLRHDGGITYLSDLMARGAMPTSWWDYPEAGHTELARREAPGFSTPKPEALMRRILTIATDPGDHVVDPFAGSGTTLLVAARMGRRFTGVERELATIRSFTRPRLTGIPYRLVTSDDDS